MRLKPCPWRLKLPYLFRPARGEPLSSRFGSPVAIPRPWRLKLLCLLICSPCATRTVSLTISLDFQEVVLPPKPDCAATAPRPRRAAANPRPVLCTYAHLQAAEASGPHIPPMALKIVLSVVLLALREACRSAARPAARLVVSQRRGKPAARALCALYLCASASGRSSAPQTSAMAFKIVLSVVLLALREVCRPAVRGSRSPPGRRPAPRQTRVPCFVPMGICKRSKFLCLKPRPRRLNLSYLLFCSPCARLAARLPVRCPRSPPRRRLCLQQYHFASPV